MAFPKPKKEETKEHFIERVKENDELKKKFPNEKELIDVCKKHFMESKKKKDQMRIDYLSSDANEEFMIEGFKRTQEGYLQGRAIITNVGVFPYVLDDGSIFYELRPPEEVFSFDSMDSFKMMPLTNEHPSEIVTKDNIKKYQVGNVGDSIYRDEYHLSAPITITDEETIMDVQAGKRAISNGYTCDVIEKSGVWMGIPYDGIQTNIRGNHIAVVTKGRAGDAAQIKMDSMNVGIQKLNKEDKAYGGNNMSLKKVKIDGVDYDAEKEVVTAYVQTQNKVDGLKKEVESLQKDNATLQAEKDQHEDELKSLQDENEELKTQNVSDEAIEKAVQERMVIFDAAKQSEVEIKKDVKIMDIKKDIVIKLFPSAKEKLDGADEVYINARFDMALDYLEEKKDENNNGELSGDSVDKGSTKTSKKSDSDSAYDRMVAGMQSNWDHTKEDK